MPHRVHLCGRIQACKLVARLAQDEPERGQALDRALAGAPQPEQRAAQHDDVKLRCRTRRWIGKSLPLLACEVLGGCIEVLHA